MDQYPEPVQQSSSSEKKIALFRSLFRGRDDVYPRRFESRKTGKSGYAPACANEWVRDYAASVRRLVRDGVDAPLGNLFVIAARPIPSEADGANRARSASEAFLYRRLETLPATRGRFQVNADLPIAFDGWGRLEVDLLSADFRIAVEVDGAQHLGDPVAYRRDRRKDRLLQENGYLVLRYLAEDVAKDLDAVLDGILRALTSQQKSAVATHAVTIVRSGRG
jgi:very-short-patch-repair endonuclease